MHIHLKSGDCLHIPSFWWYAFEVEVIDESGAELTPSISIDYWYAN